MSSYMAEPRKEFERRLVQKGISFGANYHLGIMAMGLEIVGLIKNLERLPVISAREEMIAALHTLLVDTGLVDSVYETYDRLAEERKPKFVADEHVAARVRSADVDRPPSPVASPPASARASHRGGPSLPGKLRASQRARRTLPSSYELGGGENDESRD